MMNYFAYPTAARRYARSRPYFHPQVIDRSREIFHLDQPVALALDVACGTGQSSQALLALAKTVIGTDIARDMLAEAPHDPRLRFVQASAEDLPLANEACDLLTVSLAFHWFDRDRFLAEARRVLQPGGGLVIYNNYWRAEMVENPQFHTWVHEVYSVRYPSPPRDRRPLTDAQAMAHGFRFVERETLANEVEFTVEALADYLMTQSNIIAHVEQGEEEAEQVYRWLIAETAPFFSGPTAIFRFGTDVMYLKKDGPLEATL